MRTRITPNTDTFYAVQINENFWLLFILIAICDFHADMTNTYVVEFCASAI